VVIGLTPSFLKPDAHAVAHVSHTRPATRLPVDDDQAIVADTHAAEQTPKIASSSRSSKCDLALRDQGGGDRFPQIGGHGPVIQEDGDLWASPNVTVQPEVCAAVPPRSHPYCPPRAREKSWAAISTRAAAAWPEQFNGLGDISALTGARATKGTDASRS